MRKKILILTPFYPPNIGGAETYTEALVNEAKSKHFIYVLTYMPFNRTAPSFQFGGGRLVQRIHWPFKPPKVWKGTTLRNLLLVVPKLTKVAISVCKENKFDTVHAQGLLCAGIGLLLKKLFKVRLVVTTLALYGFKGKKRGVLAIVRFVLNRADMIFVEGKEGRDDLLDAGVTAPMKTFQHWVDLKKFKPSNAKHSGVRVLFVGRPIPEKGINVIKQAQYLIEKYPDKIIFTYAEDVEYSELIQLYKKSDILVVPSLYQEGFARVVIEGAACGCAIITSDRGALPELVDPFGITLPTDPKVWRDLILDIAENRRRLKRLQAQSRAYAEKNFSNKNAEEIINDY